MNFLEARLSHETEKPMVYGEGFQLSVPEKLKERFLKAKDRELILGIRPEHLYDHRLKATFPGGELLTATVEVVEPIGSQIILLASSGGVQLTACVDPQTEAKPATEMEFLVDMNRMHLFDKETQKAY
jgi:multiple sugar transport system ATP-binding protein